MSDSRAGSLAGLLEPLGLDAFLLQSQPDLRWLTGFTGSNGLVVCGPQARVLVTDFRYTEQAADEVDGFDVRVADGELAKELGGILDGGGTLGFDPSSVTVEQRSLLESELPSAWSLIPAGSPLSSLRSIKDREEIASIREATRLADEAFGRVVGAGIVGRTERDIAWALEREIRELGGQGVSFPPIVAAGARGALPHAAPTDLQIPSDALVVIDWGAVVDGYCSDCTRTVATGSVGDDERAVHGIVLEAQQAALEALRPGPTGRELDSIARGIIETAGYGEAFGHGLGHGVGLEIHEAPTLGRRRSDEPMETGMVVTVEPGIYLEGRFGVRIEELCLVGEQDAGILTTLPRDMVVVD